MAAEFQAKADEIDSDRPYRQPAFSGHSASSRHTDRG
jgi:hypothetical protein